MRDVLDLRHRHPRLYDAVLAGKVRFFQARHVVRATRHAGLSLEQARGVDARVAPYAGEVGWGRLLGLVESAVVAADPEAAERRRLDAEMARFVRTGRSSEFGTKTIYARARAGDAIFFFAMCDRIAQILRLQGSHGVAGPVDVHPDDAAAVEMDVLRSEALGILATPARALALLAWAEGVDPEVPVSPSIALPPATLYVHMSEDSFRRRTRDAVDVEEVGPVTVEPGVDLLGHCHVTVKPVVDLNVSPREDGYRPSATVREIVDLRHRVEVFPGGTLTSRKADGDHTVPYVPADEGGPPGQTTPDNLGPLSRFHHRLKTHGGWRCTQPERGVFLWRSPHGHWARVDARGTRYLGKDPGPVVTVTATVTEQRFRLLLAA